MIQPSVSRALELIDSAFESPGRRPLLWRAILLLVAVLLAFAVMVQSGSERAEAAPNGRALVDQAVAERDVGAGEWFPLVAIGVALLAVGVALGLIAATTARLRRLRWPDAASAGYRIVHPVEIPDPGGVRHTTGIQIARAGTAAPERPADEKSWESERAGPRRCPSHHREPARQVAQQGTTGQ